MRLLCVFLLLWGSAAAQVIPRSAPTPETPAASPPPLSTTVPPIPALPAVPPPPKPQPTTPPSTPAPPAPETPPQTPPPAPTTAPVVPELPAAQPASVSAETAPWSLPAFATNCTPPMQQKLALHRAAAAIADGQGHAAALKAQNYGAQRYRYWEVSAGGVTAALTQACTQGLHEFGLAPVRSRWIVLAARPESETSRATPAPVAPASAPQAISTPTQSVPSHAPEAATGTKWPVGGRLGELLTLVNEVRQKGYTCGGLKKAPVAPLTYDVRLTLSAQLHVNAMTLQGFADHVNPLTHSTPQTRAAAEGWTGEVGENLYSGGQTAAETLAWWLGSSVHCANLMSPYWTHFGAGLAASSAKAPDGPYWVLDFGHAVGK